MSWLRSEKKIIVTVEEKWLLYIKKKKEIYFNKPRNNQIFL